MKVDNQFVPPPSTGGRGRRSVYNFRGIPLGGSAVYEGSEQELAKTRIAAHAFGSYNGMKFQTAMIDGGIRVWRVE